MADRADWAWMDGKIVPWAKATVHVSSDTVLRGANVFEGMRGYWNAAERELYIFRNAEHLRRLRQSAKIVRYVVPYSDDELTRAFISLIRKNGFEEGIHFRPVVYLGEGEPYGVDPDEIHHGVFVIAYARPHAKSLTTGIRSCTSTWRRGSDVSTPSRLKSAANYHNSRLATVEARLNGFGAPVMLNERGKVAEGPGAAFMMVRDGRVVTPPVTADILESITRATLLELCRDLGIPAEEREIDRTELYIADEAFFCGSGAEVQPVVELDHYKLGDGTMGPITKRLQDLYFAAARGDEARYRHWLTPVYGRAAGARSASSTRAAAASAAPARAKTSRKEPVAARTKAKR